MDKHERVAVEVAVELVGTPVMPHEKAAVLAILRREYGDDEYIHKEIARVATLEALEEAARVCDETADGLLEELGSCVPGSHAWRHTEGLRCQAVVLAAAIRALKDGAG